MQTTKTYIQQLKKIRLKHFAVPHIFPKLPKYIYQTQWFSSALPLLDLLLLGSRKKMLKYSW